MQRAPIKRIALALIGLGFAFGATTHALDFWRFGWAPYQFGPPALNAFWNTLVFIDASVVALLLSGRTRNALALGIGTMVCDVAANSYAWTVLGIPAFATALIVQTGFLGFMLGSSGFLWRRGAARGTV